MSEISSKEEFTTKLKSDTFLHFADNSIMGILIIQTGYLKYYNKRFAEIFGYTKEEISQWKKREFYKIVHPEDLAHLVEFFKVENDKRTVSVQFRGVKKSGEIIDIQNYISYIEYNSKPAYLSGYVPLETSHEKLYTPKIIKITSKKKITLDYEPKVIKILKENNLEFDTYNICSYREEF